VPLAQVLRQTTCICSKENLLAPQALLVGIICFPDKLQGSNYKKVNPKPLKRD